MFMGSRSSRTGRGCIVRPRASPERTRGRWKSIGIFALIVAIVGGCVATGSFADIAPTILDAVGIEQPGGIHLLP